MGFVGGDGTKYPTPSLRRKLLNEVTTVGKDEKLNVYDFCWWENTYPANMAKFN
jgi:hypothetical protein